MTCPRLAFTIALLFTTTTTLITCTGNDSDTTLPSRDTAVSTVSVAADTAEFPARDAAAPDAPRIPLDDIRENDGYWRRGVVYETDRPGELLAHVRVAVRDSMVRFYCMGMDTFAGPEDTVRARFYEIEPGGPAAVIDSFDFPAHDSRWVSTSSGRATTELMLQRHYDNLRIRGDELLYYVENTDRFQDSTTETPLRCMAYTIGSGRPAREINKHHFSDGHRHVQMSEVEHAVHSPDRRLCAFTDVYNIVIYHDGDMGDAFRRKEPLSWPPLDRDRGDFTVAPLFPDLVGREIVDDDYVLVGGMSWQDDSRRLYFDNSGQCYACIWMLDIGRRDISKIVPEHEAIHPCYFAYHGRGYVAYVFGGRLMAAERPADEPLWEPIHASGVPLKSGELDRIADFWFGTGSVIFSFVNTREQQNRYAYDDDHARYGLRVGDRYYGAYTDGPRSLVLGVRYEGDIPNGLCAAADSLLAGRGHRGASGPLAALGELAGIPATVTPPPGAPQFTYVNPEFVTWAFANLVPEPTRPFSGVQARIIYHGLFRRIVRLMASTYLHLRHTTDIDQEVTAYRAAAEDPETDVPTYLYERYGVLQLEPETSWFDCCMSEDIAAGFWLRRVFDGSADKIWQGMERFLRFYDRDWYCRLQIDDSSR